MKQTQARAKDLFFFLNATQIIINTYIQFAYELKFLIGKVGNSVPEFLGQVTGGGIYPDSFMACGHCFMVFSTWAKNTPAPFPAMFLTFYPSSSLRPPLPPLLTPTSG